MADDMFTALSVSAAGMRAQSTRVRVVAENMANADSTGTTPGADPYRRQTVTFKNELDRATGAEMVEVSKIGTDKKTPFVLKYQPDHPAADDKGYVKMPNIDSIVEMMDMREAQRSYEANLGMIEQSRTMMMQTINLLRQ
ncbi:flagellar basal body rod protein FlgC [Micavibrio aeruginosavorus]|uniref:Flagellar basal-body rod protein FlgC n=1 Tax=Micavibrio aeruginosavorus (strain ARL-13) TaxID=856793 RepID=G2KRQ6_MICAA|nr:flagellar basal body rod protein FlgC [Micavibrio aeruginosavorus]AEP10014.1 flagellar basal-body rod protein FlgC [Micavibrio aeruginosavorus ARL-13]